mmetsp:Transcript_14574/g.49747  ORF Transcript_14574/g.49747 Transcript_14574/m.49747 type:complete len:476 (-) Transcript_14574:336-1763(-)
MGNSGTKGGAAAIPGATDEELASFKHNFTRIVSLSGKKDLDETSLREALKLPPSLSSRLFAAMRKVVSESKGSAGSKLMHFSMADTALVLGRVCTTDRFDRRSFSLSVLFEGSKTINRKLARELYKTIAFHSLPDDGNASALAERLADISVDNAFEEVQGDEMTREEGDNWLQREVDTEGFLPDLLRSAFLLSAKDSSMHKRQRNVPRLARKSRLLSDEVLWIFGPQLPPTCVQKPWKQLYSSVKHGKSFSRFMSKILFRGPTLLIFKDKLGCVFGGFASVSWHKSNKFYGDGRCFLFSSSPRMKIFPASNVNNNFMWLSTNLTSCSNGLGMGGQKDFWGIYVDTMLERGVCRAPCSSFCKMPCLSSSPEFEFEEVEVWGCIPDYVADEKELEAAGVKRKPVKSLDDYTARKDGKTVLDDVEAKAILDAAGVGGYSDDVRAYDAVLAKEEKSRKATREEADAGSDSDDLEYQDED